MFDQFALLPALGRQHLDAPFRANVERVLQNLAILDFMREQNQRRGRVLAVKLRQKRPQHLLFREALIGARKIGAVAPVLKGAKKERLDAEAPRVLGDREDVGLFDGMRIDSLRALYRRQRGDAVAQSRRALELQSLRRLRHLGGEPLAHAPALAGQKILGLGHQLLVIGDRDFAGAGAGAAFDLIEQAGPRAVLVKGIDAGAQKKGALQRVERAIDRPDAGEGAEIIALARPRAAMLGDLRGVVIPRDQNIGEGFVVAHQHVEARLQLLDEIGLEQQRVGLGLDRDEHHVGCRGDHPRDAVHMAGEAGVARHALSHILGLADIEHLAVGGDHAIDAGTVGRVLPMALDQRDAALDALGRVQLWHKIDAGAFLQREIFVVLRDVILKRGVVGPVGRNHEADLGARALELEG